MEATQLYRHWDKEGNLLYVGISYNTLARLKQHKRDSQWQQLVTTITIENFATRKEAEAAEFKAIRIERPIYNVVGTARSDTKPSKRYFLYEFIQKHLYLLDKQKEIVVTTSDLRDAAKVDTTEYLEFKELNRRLIKPTLQDIYKQLGVKLAVKGNKHTVTFTRG